MVKGRVELAGEQHVGGLPDGDPHGPGRIRDVRTQQPLGGHRAAGAGRTDTDAKACQVVDRARTRSRPDEQMNGRRVQDGNAADVAKRPIRIGQTAVVGHVRDSGLREAQIDRPVFERLEIAHGARLVDELDSQFRQQLGVTPHQRFAEWAKRAGRHPRRDPDYWRMPRHLGAAPLAGCYAEEHRQNERVKRQAADEHERIRSCVTRAGRCQGIVLMCRNLSQFPRLRAARLRPSLSVDCFLEGV